MPNFSIPGNGFNHHEHHATTGCDTPHIFPKTRPSGIMCFNPRSLGLATSSKSRKFASLTRFDRNSSPGLRVEFGIYQDASTRDTLPKDERSRSWEGVIKKGVAEDVMLLHIGMALWPSCNLLMSDKEIMYQSSS